MSFSQSDIPHIKWSLITFLVTLAIGSSMVIIAQKYANQTHRSVRSAQQQLTEARSKLNAARDDQENMSTYTKEYSAIQNRGVIGDEQRLNLIEGLDELRGRNVVVDLKYEISPQQAYKPLTTLNTGNFELKYSPMKLQIELMHEGQLIRFFENLRRDINGWFILEQCSLEHSTLPNAQLKADCSGGWLTLKNRNAK